MAPLLPINTQKIEDYPWQKTAVEEIVTRFQEGKKGILLKGGTGLGKEIIKCMALRSMIERDLLKTPEGSICPFPILWICPKNMEVTTRRNLLNAGIAHLTMVTTFGQIKSSMGTDIWLKWETKTLPNGQPELVPVWNRQMLPAILVVNEIQLCKNESSQQTKVVRYCPDDVLFLSDSATPGQRVADFRCVIERCQAVTKYNYLPATKYTAPAILRDIASPKHPSEYSPKAMERLMDAISDNVVELKNVRFKFPTRTCLQNINFRSREQQQDYDDAYNEYLRELAKKGIQKNHGFMALFVAMQKFRQKAELLRCDQIAELAWRKVTQQGRMVIVGSEYVDTCRAVWKFLVKRHGVMPEDISFMVGGQSTKERQRMMDDYQEGRTHYMLVTTRTGGAGVSLNHDREGTMPRTVILPFPWSAIDLVQFLGRGHRINSKSATEQVCLFYENTIETQRVKPKLEVKLKCINKFVKAKEQFISFFEKASEEDVTDDKNEEYNEILHSGVDADNGEDDIDNPTTEDAVSGEGLDSVSQEEWAAPTTYR